MVDFVALVGEMEDFKLLAKTGLNTEESKVETALTNMILSGF